MTNRIACVLVLLGVCSALVGCGSSDAASVTGTVTYNGQPLEDGTLIIHPASGRPAHGTIKAGQIVEVTTLEPGDGAPPGPVKLAVQSTKPDPKDPSGMASISKIPKKYTDSATSGLEAVLEAGKVNELKLELKD